LVSMRLIGESDPVLPPYEVPKDVEEKNELPVAYLESNNAGYPILEDYGTPEPANFSRQWRRLKDKFKRRDSQSQGSVPSSENLSLDVCQAENVTEMSCQLDLPRSSEGVKNKLPNCNSRSDKPKIIISEVKKLSIPQPNSSQPSSDSEEGGKLTFFKLSPEKWRNKRTNIIKAIPNECMKQWRENCWRELNRFTKLSANSHIVSRKGETIPWVQRIFQDLQRSRKLVVCGEINESFEFPRFAHDDDRETLVLTCMKFLNTSLDDLISEACPSLGTDGRAALASKAVNQALISLCQDFINEPYFKILKSACERYSLTPSGSNMQIEIGKYVPGVTISVESPKMNCHVCRTFKTMRIVDMEAIPTDLAFGFKRTYSIDIMGGPPKISPPTWLAKKEDKVLEFFSASVPKSPFKPDPKTSQSVQEEKVSIASPEVPEEIAVIKLY